jgi:hypothetical protein
MARVLSAIGPAVNHYSPKWPKLFASLIRRFSRCFSIAGDRPSRISRFASRHFSRARATEMPPPSIPAQIDGLPTAVEPVIQAE